MSPNSPTVSDATVLVSGGIDSFALCHLLKSRSLKIRGLFIDYGQAASVPEWHAVQRQAEFLGVDFAKIICKAPASFGTGELVGRNAFLLTAAAFFAAETSKFIAIGIHAGVPYFDCSPAFYARIRPLIEEQSGGRLSVLAPFLDWYKPQIFGYMRDSGLPLNATYSCESGSIPPCSTCASCRDRGALGC